MAKTGYLTAPPKTTGMPPGVPYIVGNEAAERFSYYGMNSILVVFMTRYLADSVFGKFRIILWLSIVYCLGHLSLSLDHTRWGLSIGLTLIALGAGGIKP